MSEVKLRSWVNEQRHQNKLDKIKSSRKKRLEEIGFDWRPSERGSFPAMFSRLIAFKRKYGHTKVPDKFRDRQLASWVARLRRLKRMGKLNADQTKQLERQGFVWDTPQEAWDKMFEKLVHFSSRHGHSNVTLKRNSKLGSWVAVQRDRKRQGRLKPHRVRKLNQLGFEWTRRGGFREGT